MYGLSRKREQVACGRANSRLSLRPRVPVELLRAATKIGFSNSCLWERVQSPLRIQAQGLNEETADSVSLGGLFNILILCIFKVYLQDTLVSFSLLLLYALKP